MPNTILFTGQMIDKDGKENRLFASTKENEVRKENNKKILHEIEKTKEK